MRLTNKRPTLRHYCSLWLLVFFLAVGVSTLSAQGVSSIAQGFQTEDSNVVSGALVGLKKGTPNNVELSTTETLDQILGVVGNKSLIELSSGSSTVQIVTNGSAAALVSDINGTVKTGDKITISPIAGIGMRATVSTLIIGTAQADLSSAEVETRTISDKEGNKKQIRIGSIPIQVDKVFYEVNDGQSSFLPPAFQDFANNLAGKKVSPIRVMIAGLLVILLFVTIIVLLYSAVRSSIISIGRNPLSESAVHKGLLQVGITVLGVMIFTVAAIYLILTT
jgi:hypothetical protein